MTTQTLEETDIKLTVTIGRSKITFQHGLCSCKKVFVEVGDNRMEKTVNGSAILMTESLLYQMASSGKWDALEDASGIILGQRGIQIYIPFNQEAN